MSSFTKPLIVEVLDDGENYALKEEFSYYREGDEKNIITVPKGFITDFASTPRLIWSILPPFGKYAKSAVLHDFLCQKYHRGEILRKEADHIFLESMKIL